MKLIVHWNAYTGPCCNPENPCDLSAKRVPHSHTWEIEPGSLKVNDYIIWAKVSGREASVGESISPLYDGWNGAINGFEVRD